MALTSLSIEAKDFVEKETSVFEHTVYFDLDKSKVKENEKVKVRKFISERPTIIRGELVVIGRADSRASEAYNVALGMRRASAVASILGVDASVSSVGEQEATGNHGLDRNVTIRVTQEDLVYSPIYGGYDVVFGPISHLQYRTIPAN